MKKIDKIQSRSFENLSPHIYQKDYEFPEDAALSDELILEKLSELDSSIREPLERQIKALESIADSAKKRAELAAAQAENAEKEAKIARRDARFAKVVSVLAIIIPIFWNSVEPYLPTILQQISKYISAG